MESLELREAISHFWMPCERLSLAALREDLVCMEESIIFGLMERAQYRMNGAIYEKGSHFCSDMNLDNGICMLEFFLRETEKLHCMSQRYSSQHEYPFFAEELPLPTLPVLKFPKVLHENSVNINSRIREVYIEKVVPMIAEAGDDGFYGLSVGCDINCLQVLSRRIHYGKFIAEAKFQSDPDRYSAMIAVRDVQKVRSFLRDFKSEEKLLERVNAKSRIYSEGLEIGRSDVSHADGNGRKRLASHVVYDIFKDLIIPLTIEVEVEYLMQRLKPIRIAFLGPENSYSHFALKRACPNSEIVSCSSIGDVFYNVLVKGVAKGIVPFENSTVGKVSETFKMLSEHSLFVVGEIYLKVAHCLASVEGDIDSIKKIYSHPQAFAQCSQFVNSHLNHAKMVLLSGTSIAANMALTKKNSASICSVEMAKSIGLNVLQTHIENSPQNTTRFVFLSHSPTSPTGDDKTLLLFGISNQVGELCRILIVFARHKIDMFSIEAFPSKNVNWEYEFLVEVDGHILLSPLNIAIKELEEKVLSLKILGSFPKHHPTDTDDP